MIDITPWSPYLTRTTLPSAGRTTLTAAFADVIKVRCGFESYELHEIFCALADDGENDACRDIVRLNAGYTAEQFISGRIPTFARPLEGGMITPLDTIHWEIDDPLGRFATGAFNLDQWAVPMAELTHRLFVDSVTFDRWLILQRPPGELNSRQIESILDPQVRAKRSLAAANYVDTNDQCSHEKQSSSSSTIHFEEKSHTIDRAEVERRTSLSRSTIYSYMGKGEFPQCFHLTNNRVVWQATEINEWINKKAASRPR